MANQIDFPQTGHGMILFGPGVDRGPEFQQTALVWYAAAPDRYLGPLPRQLPNTRHHEQFGLDISTGQFIGSSDFWV